MNKIRYIVTILPVIVLVIAGCTATRMEKPITGSYYLNPAANFAGIGRVVVFELENRSAYAELSKEVTSAIIESFGKKCMFGLTPLWRTDPAWRNLDLGRSEYYSLEELSVIRSNLQADAVVFGSILRYQPYPHTLISLNLKMVDLRSGALIWASEQVWDSTDRQMEDRMKTYFEQQMRSGYQPMGWKILFTAPSFFSKFVADDLAGTFSGA